MTTNSNNILRQMTMSLWKLANMPLRLTGGKRGSQRSALRLLLEIHGGAGFVASRGRQELEELDRRGVWVGPITLLDTLRELAGLEVRKLRLDKNLADIQSRIRSSTSKHERSKNRAPSDSVSSSVQ
jgi:hypothetical protein